MTDIDNRDNIDNTRNKSYKSMTIDEYVEIAKEEFEEIPPENLNAGTKIHNANHYYEFKELLKHIQYRYGSRFAEWMIFDGGGTHFYSLYSSTDLIRLVKVIQKTKRCFENKIIRLYTTVDSLFPTDTDIKLHKRITIHCSNEQNGQLETISDDLNITKGQLSWIYTVLFFNKARCYLKEFDTEKFKLYYDDDGYLKSIKNEMENSVKITLYRIASTFPELIKEIGYICFLIDGKKFNNVADQKNNLELKLESIEELIKLFEEKKVDLTDDVKQDINDFKMLRLKDSYINTVPNEMEEKSTERSNEKSDYEIICSLACKPSKLFKNTTEDEILIIANKSHTNANGDPCKGDVYYRKIADNVNDADTNDP